MVPMAGRRSAPQCAPIVRARDDLLSQRAALDDIEALLDVPEVKLCRDIRNKFVAHAAPFGAPRWDPFAKSPGSRSAVISRGGARTKTAAFNRFLERLRRTPIPSFARLGPYRHGARSERTGWQPQDSVLYVAGGTWRENQQAFARPPVSALASSGCFFAVRSSVSARMAASAARQTR
jgi:hypothetical protein